MASRRPRCAATLFRRLFQRPYAEHVGLPGLIDEDEAAIAGFWSGDAKRKQVTLHKRQRNLRFRFR